MFAISLAYLIIEPSTINIPIISEASSKKALAGVSDLQTLIIAQVAEIGSVFLDSLTPFLTTLPTFEPSVTLLKVSTIP